MNKTIPFTKPVDPSRLVYSDLKPGDEFSMCSGYGIHPKRRFIISDERCQGPFGPRYMFREIGDKDRGPYAFYLPDDPVLNVKRKKA